MTLSDEHINVIKEFNRSVAYLKQRDRKQKAQYVKVGFITDLTGWNPERLRKARRDGLVKFKKEGTQFWYDPNSIDPIFHKKMAAAQTTTI